MSSACQITCAVRVRPANARELKYKSSCCIDMTGGTTQIYNNSRRGTSGSGGGGDPPREFPFDFAFWTHDKEEKSGRPYADQALVFKSLGQPILENCLDGYNGCLFAYGQTGAGKSYSMLGTASDPGITIRLIRSIFSEIQTRTEKGVACKVEVSFCEIYNEACSDLLGATASVALKVRQDPKEGIFVQGLSKITTSNAEQFEGLLNKALDNRAIASTNMNATSSRSHAVILVKIVQVEAGTSCTRTSKLSLIDLAGSERAESTGASGSTLKEAQNINYSLSVLGMCLSRLADIAEAKVKTGAHVPFRDSSLTWLLSDNLGGNSKTSMLAAISPADVNYEETVSTLRFASVTKRVKTKAVVNESANDKLIRELRSELADLQGTLAAMKTDMGSEKAVAALTAAAAAAAQNSEENDEGVNESDDQLQPSMSAADILHQNMKPSFTGEEEDSQQAQNAQEELQQQEEKSKVPSDWRVPQFMELTPSSTGDNAGAVEVIEGDNQLHIGKSKVTVSFSGLTGEVLMTVEPSDNAEPIYHNGQVLNVGSTCALKQNDRLIAGDQVLRFSHYQTVLDAEGKSFRTEPDSDRHCILLESYYRTMIQKESLDEMMELLAVIGMDDDAHPDLRDAVADAVVLLEIEQQMLHSEAFQKEAALQDEFPQIEISEEFNISFDAAAYAEAMAEQKKKSAGMAREVEERKKKLEQAAVDQETSDLQNVMAAKATRDAAQKQARQLIEDAEQEIAEMSEAARAEENALQDQLDDAASERVLAVELAYHKEVRYLRQFRPQPNDTEDLAVWKRQAKIIQNDARLNCLRMGENIEVNDPSISATTWTPYTVCLSKRFVYLYKKTYRREALAMCMYLPGATTNLTVEPSSSSSSNKNFQVVDLTSAVARTPAPEHQRDPPTLRLRFTDAREARAWRAWCDHNATPAPPLSIWRRQLEQEVEECLLPEEQGKPTMLPGKPFEMKGWAPDDSTDKCTRCSKQFGLLTRKHHCRGECGEIFCSSCLDSKKVCIACQATIQKKSDTSTAGADGSDSAGSGEQPKDKTTRSTAGRHSSQRIIDNESTSNFVDDGKYFAIYLRSKILRFSARRDLDDFNCSLAAEREEEDEDLGDEDLGLIPTKNKNKNINNDDNKISVEGNPNAANLAAKYRPYLLDLFRGRFHEWCAVDISHVWRDSFHPLAVNIKLGGDGCSGGDDVASASAASAASGGVCDTSMNSAAASENENNNNNQGEEQEKTFVSIICTSVVDREHLFEGLAMMIGRRGYSPIRSGIGSNEYDVLVNRPEDASSSSQQQQANLIKSTAIRLTNQLRLELRVRVSRWTENQKFSFQQGEFDIIAATAIHNKPPWTKQYLRSASMVSLCEPIPLTDSLSLFVAADEHVAQHTTPPVSANSQGVCVVTLGVHESNILLVASTTAGLATFDEVDENEYADIIKDETEAAERESQPRFSHSDNNNHSNSNNKINLEEDEKNENENNNCSPGSNKAEIGSPPGNLESVRRESHNKEEGNENNNATATPSNAASELPKPNDQLAILRASGLPLENMIMWPLNKVDPIEQFDNVFVISHFSALSGFSRSGKAGIQFRGSDGQIVVESESHVEASIHVPQLILTSLRMKTPDDDDNSNQLPSHINVKIAKLFDPVGHEVHGPHDHRVTVVVNMPFETCKAAIKNLSFTSEVAATASAAVASSSSESIQQQQQQHHDPNTSSSSSSHVNKVGNTIRLLDRVAEHATSKNLYVIVEGVGSATVPFHLFAKKDRHTVVVPANLMYCGIQTGKVNLAISLIQ